MIEPTTVQNSQAASSRVPDALLVAESMKSGARQIDRVNSVLDIAEPLLAVDRANGERAYIRRQPGGRLFITRCPADTLLHPIGHPLEGRERYHWSPLPGNDYANPNSASDGDILYGFLSTGALPPHATANAR